MLQTRTTTEARAEVSVPEKPTWKPLIIATKDDTVQLLLQVQNYLKMQLKSTDFLLPEKVVLHKGNNSKTWFPPIDMVFEVLTDGKSLETIKVPGEWAGIVMNINETLIVAAGNLTVNESLQGQTIDVTFYYKINNISYQITSLESDGINFFSLFPSKYFI